jgi:hypothetical protein
MRQSPRGVALRNTQQANEPPARLDKIFQGIAVEDISECRTCFLQRPPQNATRANNAGSIERLEARHDRHIRLGIAHHLAKNDCFDRLSEA